MPLGAVVALQVGVPVLLLLGAWVWGGVIERAHLADLRRREARFRDLRVLSVDSVPPNIPVLDSGLVGGGVVISIDYFKAFVAGIWMVLGGRIRSFEPLLDRARREALQRLRESARRAGYDMVVGVRIETAPIAGRINNQGTAGVEVFAYGTGLRSR